MKKTTTIATLAGTCSAIALGAVLLTSNLTPSAAHAVEGATSLQAPTLPAITISAPKAEAAEIAIDIQAPEPEAVEVEAESVAEPTEAAWAAEAAWAPEPEQTWAAEPEAAYAEPVAYTEPEPAPAPEPEPYVQPACTVNVNGVVVGYGGSYASAEAPAVGAGLWLGSDSVNDGSWGYFIGHNPGPFSCVMALGYGQPVTVCDSTGAVRTYCVVDAFTVPNTTYWEDIQARVSGYGESVILQTCCGDDANYRIVVCQ